jgi:uncharacterized integral membrane protein
VKFKLLPVTLVSFILGSFLAGSLFFIFLAGVQVVDYTALTRVLVSLGVRAAEHEQLR